MRRIIIIFLCVTMLGAAWQRACGFALLGPSPSTPSGDLSAGLPSNFGDSWQTVAIGYGLPYENETAPGSPNWLGDLGGPKNLGVQGTEDSIGEGYRRNDPVLYYAYDANFEGFFGPQGEANVDQAFAIMNAVFTNHPNGVDGYSANLSEFPFDSQAFNGTAQALYLTDIKSVALHLLVEQMGLAEPERFTWALHDREVNPSPPSCPENITYLVVQRNYDTVNQPLGEESGTLYSPYVNDILYTYGIRETCGAPGIPWTAITVPFSTDTTVPEYTAVAANNFEFAGGFEGGLGGLQIGGFYTGLTEDDVAGLRYLMSSNSYAYENAASGALLEATNFSTLQLLQTSDLGALYSFALTNPPAAVSNEFPGLVINTVSNYFTIVSNPIIVSYYTNYPGSAAGSLPQLVIRTNGYTYTPQTNYVYTFDNLVIVNEHTNTIAEETTVSLAQLNGAPVGTGIYTNTTVKKIVLTNVISGDYYIIPTNSCGFNFVKVLLKNNRAGATTNIIASITNATTGFVGTQSIVTYFTNNWYEYYGCNFETSGPAEYQGIQHIQFVRVEDSNVDPLTQAFFTPITNSYTMNMVTNHQLVKQTFQRVVTAPDFLLTATDDGQANTFNGTVTRSIFFEVGNILNGLAGPGVIDHQSVFDFNRIGTAWWNGPFSDTNSFLIGQESEVNQTTQTPSLLWASFDGTTNTPVVYPSSLSVQELESQMLITISPTSLPDGTNGVPYTPTQFSAQGGTSPYYWSIATNSLPSGLALVGNELEGTPNGNTNGVYDVTVQMTDSSVPANVILTDYTITIQ